MKKKELIPVEQNILPVHREREGLFKQGVDKKGRPYEKKMDTDGIYTKEERLLSGKKKYTIITDK